MTAYESFRSRDFRLFLAASLLSNFGMQMLSAAVSWDLYLETKSALVLGNVGFVQVTPFLVFALLAGHLADRLDRRRIMMWTQAVVIAASAVLLTHTRSVALIYGVLLLTASARAFQGPARMAILPHVVPPDGLRNAITWHSSAQEIANIGAPALAGILLASEGSGAVYLGQLICSALGLLCVYLLRVRFEASRKMSMERRDLLEGVRFVRRDALILPAISLDLFAVLFGGATALLPIFAVGVLHAGASGFGWLRAAPALGAVSMAFILSHLPTAKRAGRTLLWAVAGFGAASIGFGMSHWLGLSFAMLVLVGACDNVSVVLRQSLVQTHTPDALKGRVLAVQNIFISCSNQLGAVESGWTAAWLGPVASVVEGGIATIAVVLGFAAKSKALRNWVQ